MNGNNQVLGGQRRLGVDTPMWVAEFDVGSPPARLAASGPAPSGEPYTVARVLIRFQGEPLGVMTVDLADGEVDVADLRSAAAERFSSQIASLAEPGWTAAAEPLPAIPAELLALADQPLPAVSVVIGTMNRPRQLVECVELVLKQDYPSPIEVIVVDNGATDSATGDAVAASFGKDDRVRYMVEARPGLSRARNIGLSAARYPVTAFLSDDIRVDALWLLALARGFARNADVHCVTGVCPPLYLDSEQQLLFESSMAWGTRQGFQPVLYAFDHPGDPVHPYRVGSFANGSNMAFDTERFRSMGGFDESLGPGTKARGGEDLDAPIRILRAGGFVAFEPAVIGWHADKYDGRPFGQHMYSYGLGLTAFLTKHLMERDTRSALLRRIPKGLPILLKAFSERDRSISDQVAVPIKYHAWHLAGRAAGPVVYLWNRRRSQR